MLDPGRGWTKPGQLWAYARDDRPWGGTDPPGVAYVYAPDRKRATHRPSRRFPRRAAGRRLWRLQIDNNAVERAFRPLALNRKNALFAGSDGGAEHWAVIASLIETCKLLGVEPQGYLADVITRIVNGHPQSRVDDLLPWAYPAIPQFKAVA